MRAGYQRRSRAGGLYFREIYALLANVYRKEGTPAIDGTDVLALPGEKKPRRKREKEPQLDYSDEELADIKARIIAATTVPPVTPITP
ncbi:hypothetical protein BN8_03662 [Fibrisoma limi BUZ 3]|uniref:Uncharacterized protein n=1 Tax=Fibrisoma limi BUZ 3 TaxID=1185876 RepID=I2GKR1_9BACT|nr:hypothetical protein [Fibrisoma limi]CCH54487.1 hypothetical protein BN8_03662 [Fibrisoma limi BUZ 3]